MVLMARLDRIDATAQRLVVAASRPERLGAEPPAEIKSAVQVQKVSPANTPLCGRTADPGT